MHLNREYIELKERQQSGVNERLNVKELEEKV